MKQARTEEELRQAQAVILPLEFGFSLEQVAMVTGISKGWVCQLRNRFIRLAGAPDPEKRKPGGRRHENMSKEEETAFLAPFFERAARGGILVVREIKRRSLRTSGTSGPIPGHRQTGKKIPESLATVGSHGLERDLCACCFRMRPVLAGSRCQGGVGVHGRIALYAGPW